MNADELRSLLTRRQVHFEERAIKLATQFRCDTGEIFNAFNNGTLQVQGKDDTLFAREVVDIWEGRPHDHATSGEAEEVAPRGSDKAVFIVYGHDLVARDALELLLRRMGMEPIILSNLPAAGDTIIEKLEHYLGEHSDVGFACVLLTPDDEGHAAGREAEKKYRARQNVVLELGMVLARLGRRRVAILLKGTVEQPSDIAGLIWIAFAERVDEVKLALYQELARCGYSPKL